MYPVGPYYGPILIPNGDGIQVHWWTKKHSYTSLSLDGNTYYGTSNMSDTSTTNMTAKTRFHNIIVNDYFEESILTIKEIGFN